MGEKDTGAKQDQNRGDRFNHLTTPFYYYCVKRVIVGVCFTTASSSRRNGFVRAAVLTVS